MVSEWNFIEQASTCCEVFMDWTQLCTYKGPCIRWKETVPFPTLHICTKISAEVITHKHLSIYN